MRLRAAVLAGALLLPLPALAQSALQDIPERPAPASPAELTVRVIAIDSLLDQPRAAYRPGDALRELRTLLVAVAAQPDMDYERRLLLTDIGAIVARSTNLPREMGIAAMQQGLAIDVSTAPTTEVYDHLMLAGMAGDARRYELALTEYRKALDLGQNLLPDDAKLEVRVKIGAVLGELGRYDEALATNADTLAAMETRFGRDNPRTCALLANLASNQVGKRDLGPADLTLSRAERVCKDPISAQFVLSRRMQVALEGGRADDAREFAARRVTLLRRLGDEGAITQAELDATELERRLVTGGTAPEGATTAAPPPSGDADPATDEEK